LWNGGRLRAQISPRAVRAKSGAELELGTDPLGGPTRSSQDAGTSSAPTPTTACRGMKIRLEGSVRPRASGRAIRDGAFMGERSWAGRFGRCAASAGFSLGRPCDLPGLCLEHVSVVVVCPRVLRSASSREVIGRGAGAAGVQVGRPRDRLGLAS
jgi:hypothetical protein